MRITLKILAVTVLGIAVICITALVRPLPGEKLTAAGIPINSSLYVTTTDDTRIAVDLWLPADLTGEQKIPALIEGGRYWRATRTTFIGRLLNLFGVAAPGSTPNSFARYFTARGYAYLLVDVRGTGASFGVHEAEYSRQEIADYAAVLDWIVEQPWSNGRAGAVGVSYAGTTAELMTTTAHPALRAVAPLYADFDAQYHLVTPGGVYQPTFLRAWNDLVSAMDRDDLCGVANASGEAIDEAACPFVRAIAGGVKPVDGDDDLILLHQAVAQHRVPDVVSLISALDYRDSRWGDVDYGTVDAFPYGRAAEIEASGVPMFIVTGWFDAATTSGALARFASLSNRQSVTIAPFSHGGGYDTDPYLPIDGELAISAADQLRELESFFRFYLKDQGEQPATGLRYLVQGTRLTQEDPWRETQQWPPADLQLTTWYLAADGGLSTTAPAVAQAADRLHVDFDTGAPGASRWLTQLGGSDVYYPQRATATADLLNYSTPEFSRDTELVGNVIVDLWLTSDQPDGAIHVYLDDMAPDGKAVYLSEGVFRVIHRKPQVDDLFYPEFGPSHSYLAADAQPMPPGIPQRVSFSLFPTAALIRQGHRLRIAIGGADAVSFARYPTSGPAPQWQLQRSAQMPSAVIIPTRDW